MPPTHVCYELYFIFVIVALHHSCLFPHHHQQNDQHIFERAFSITTDSSIGEDDENEYLALHDALQVLFESGGKDSGPRWKKFLDQCLMPGSPVEIGLRKIRDSTKKNSGNKKSKGNDPEQRKKNNEDWEKIYALLPDGKRESTSFWVRETSKPCEVPIFLRGLPNVFENYCFSSIENALKASVQAKKKNNTVAGSQSVRPAGLSIVGVLKKNKKIRNGGYIKAKLVRIGSIQAE